MGARKHFSPIVLANELEKEFLKNTGGISRTNVRFQYVVRWNRQGLFGVNSISLKGQLAGCWSRCHCFAILMTFSDAAWPKFSQRLKTLITTWVTSRCSPFILRLKVSVFVSSAGLDCLFLVLHCVRTYHVLQQADRRVHSVGWGVDVDFVSCFSNFSYIFALAVYLCCNSISFRCCCRTLSA